jgi:anaerobic selenocysteine-containing dehydrogenase
LTSWSLSDVYLNETTRHADVILAGTTPLRRPHFDFAFYGLSVRNVANYSPPLFDLPEGSLDEWEILLRLGATLTGQGSQPDIRDTRRRRVRHDDRQCGGRPGVADPWAVTRGDI